MASCRPTANVPTGKNAVGTTTPTNGTVQHTDTVQHSEKQIIVFCSGCHALPKPASFPQSAWYDEVKRGFDFYHQSARKDLSPPPVQAVVVYFRTRAPKSLAAPRLVAAIALIRGWALGAVAGPCIMPMPIPITASEKPARSPFLI